MITLEDIMKSVASSWKCQLIQMYCIGQIPWNVLPWWFSKWWATLGKILNKTKHSLPLIYICWHCCSVAKFVWLFCNPMKYSMPNSPVLHYLLEFAQIHVHWVSDAIYPWGGQSIGASATVLPVNIQGWFLLGLTVLIFLQSKGLSRVFSNTTVWKHQFFGAQPSLWSNSHICTWLLEKPQLWLYGPLLAKWCLWFLIPCLGSS